MKDDLHAGPWRSDVGHDDGDVGAWRIDRCVGQRVVRVRGVRIRLHRIEVIHQHGGVGQHRRSGLGVAGAREGADPSPRRHETGGNDSYDAT